MGDDSLPTSAPSFELFLLGAFRLERHGRLIQLPTRKAESLLAYLALYPEAHAREKIAALFWGDSPDDLARRSLRTALSSLRKELGNDVLAADRESVQFNPANHVWVDAIELQQQAAQFLTGDSPDLTAINFDLYRGDLLADFYDDWILAERDHLRALYFDTLLRMTQRLREHSEYARAIEIARKALAVDAANEQAHQHVMFCTWSLGDRSAALKQFDECKRALRDELGVEPSPDTLALYERIKQASIAVPSAAAANTNLPVPLTSFIGREGEIATVKQLLGSTRLLTLTGVGGCGKTRLAIRVARDVLDQFNDGVWWVELAAAHEDERVLQLVVKAVGLVESQQVSPLEALLNHLRTKQTLLVIDNCEHLIRACAALAETILSQCAHVRILTTSREALSISGEIAWLVPSLSVPAKYDAHAPEHPAQSESVRLFVERATAIRSDFALTPANAQAVAHICRRLDGIPLAIELAAARLKALTVEQIDARLDDRFGLLTTGSRTALPRQQTLRATIDWSYALLSSAEQTLLRRLSVFSGGWTLEAAEAACAGGEVEPAQVLDLLTHLADKSLLIADYHDQGAVTRFRMLETIRQYADEMLQPLDQKDETRDRHANFFLTLAEAVESKIHGREQLELLNQLELEHDNFRTVLAWALSEAGNAILGLRLAGALWWFWNARGHLTEGRAWLTTALAQHNDMPSKLRVAFLNRGGWLACRQDDYATGRAYFEESLSLSESSGDKRAIGEALCGLARVAESQSDYAHAEALYDQSLTLFRELGDTWNLAVALLYRGAIPRRRGDYARAEVILTQSLELFQKLQDYWGIASTLHALAVTMHGQNNNERAETLLAESLALAEVLGDRGRIPWVYLLQGIVARSRKDYGQAKLLYDRSLFLFRQLGSKDGMAVALLNQGLILHLQGDHSEAELLLAESLKLARELGDELDTAWGVAAMGRIAMARGQLERAVRLFGKVQARIDASGLLWIPDDRSEYERCIAVSRAQLDPVMFATAWAEGQAMTLEQAVEEAMRM